MLSVKLSSGQTKQIQVPDFNVPVSILKTVIADAVDIPPDEQRIVFRGKILKDDQVAASCGIADGTAIHVVRAVKNSSAAPPAPADNTAPASVPPSIPTTTQPTTTQPNPYADLFAQSPGASPFGAWPAAGAQDMQTAMLSNPAMMQQAMLMMQQNPAMVEAILQNHPMMQGMTAAQRSSMIQMMANPQFMQMAMAMGSGAQPLGLNTPPTVMPTFPNQQISQQPAQRYTEQLAQLRNMGFPNESANLAALEMTGGNVEFAVARLLGE